MSLTQIGEGSWSHRPCPTAACLTLAALLTICPATRLGSCLKPSRSCIETLIQSQEPKKGTFQLFWSSEAGQMCLHLLLQQLRPTGGSLGSAPAALCPPPLLERGSHQPSQPRWGQPGHGKAPAPLKLSSGPLPIAFFAEPGSRDPHLHREPHSPSSPMRPGSPGSQFLSRHRHCPNSLANATGKLAITLEAFWIASSMF